MDNSTETPAVGKVTMPPAGPECVRAAAETPGRRRAAWPTGLRPGGDWRVPAAAGFGSFLVLSAVLMIRNAYLFTTKIYENQDFAANTIAVLQAKHFQLLTGNYSKEHFYHPGPAFLYLMALGESLFHDALHLVPTPWNGQLMVLLLLNAMLIAAAIAVIARHARSVRVTVGCLLVVLLVVAVHPLTINSPWMPYVYFAPALLLLVSAASVATGETFGLPLLAVAAWLCIHGQAEFLVFAPAIVFVALGGLLVTHRRDPGGAFRGARWHWIGAAVVSGLFALPIVIYTVQNWPGEFGQYMRYRENIARLHQIHHSLATSLGYTLRFWWPGTPTASANVRGACVAAVLATVALVLALRCPVPGLRRFLVWSLVTAAVMTAVFVYYAQTAISDKDVAQQAYLGYFYWAAPLMVVVVAAAGAVVHLTDRRAVMLPLTAAVVAAAVVATLVPQHQDNPYDPPANYRGVSQLPQVMRGLELTASGRPIVVRINDGAWPEAVGVIAHADRIGVRSCVVGGPRGWGILFRSQSLCTAREVRTGVPFWFSDPRAPVPRGQVAVVRLPEALITRPLATVK